jgi:hypothetical protein
VLSRRSVLLAKAPALEAALRRLQQEGHIDRILQRYE